MKDANVALATEDKEALVTLLDSFRFRWAFTQLCELPLDNLRPRLEQYSGENLVELGRLQGMIKAYTDMPNLLKRLKSDLIREIEEERAKEE